MSDISTETLIYSGPWPKNSVYVSSTVLKTTSVRQEAEYFKFLLVDLISQDQVYIYSL